MIFMYSIALGEMFIWRIQIWQLNYTIDCFIQKRKRISNILTMMATYRKILIYVSKINPYFGKAFLAFLSVNVPIQCFLFKVGLFDKISPFQKTILVATGFSFFDNFLLLHLVIAKLNWQLLEMSKRMISFPTHYPMTRRARLELSLFLQGAYTKEMYGLTYWKFGLISMVTFGKVSDFFIRIHSDKFFNSIVCCDLLSNLHVRLHVQVAKLRNRLINRLFHYKHSCLKFGTIFLPTS